MYVASYYRGAEKSVPEARTKTVRENMVTLIVNKLPKCKKCMFSLAPPERTFQHPSSTSMRLLHVHWYESKSHGAF